MAQPTLTPAYGRDYTSRAGVLEALRAGRDFFFHCFGHKDDGRYCTVVDLKPGRFTVRYDGHRKVATFTRLRVDENAPIADHLKGVK